MSDENDGQALASRKVHDNFAYKMTTTKATILQSDRFSSDEARWQAVQARDPAAESAFVYGVKTTGIYCGPTSSARLPNRENVEFFATAADAEAAGYRASRRSATTQAAALATRTELVARACHLIAHADLLPSLEALAMQAGLSTFHFHRVFKAETGLTPKAYANASRSRRLRQTLVASPTITDAIYNAGFNSSSRFYEGSIDLLGMSPTEFRDGGVNTVIHFAVGQCSLGAILVAQSKRGICAIFLGEDPDQLVRDLQDQFKKALLIGGDAGFERVVAQVVGAIEQPALGLNLPLDIRGTAFQERVWRALSELPPGTQVSYAQLAARIGSPKAVRAVAQACGANCLAVAIPCHRVIRSDGNLSGYRWGVERKRELLAREAQGTERT